MRIPKHIADKAKPTVLDRVVRWWNPVRGLQRHKARLMMAATSGGYIGGRRDRRMTRGWRPADDSADAAILPDLDDLRNRSRDLTRNAPMAAGAVNTVVTSVVGEGLQIKPEVDRDVLGFSEDETQIWQQDAIREWRLFSKTCDTTSVQSFNELQAMVLRSVLESGDLFVIRRFREDFGDLYGLKLQVVEADRVSNPEHLADGMELDNGNKVYGGIEVNRDGRHMAIWVADQHPGAIRALKTEWRRVPMRTRQGVPIVLHLYDRMRPDQSRGVPYLAPVIEAFKQIADYTEAEITAAVIGAMFTVFVTSDLDDGDESSVLPGVTGSTSLAGSAGDELELGNGAVIELAQGDKVETADPTRPNSTFEPFMHAILEQTGAALELPSEVLRKHFTASYSAARAALEQAWQFFRRRRQWLASSFCQPTWEWFLEEAAARNTLNLPGFLNDPRVAMSFCRCDWRGPSRIQLDPLKEAKADAADIETGVKTRERVIMERTGSTFEQTHEQLAKEARMRREAGLGAVATSSPATEPETEDDDEEAEEDAA